MILVALVFFVLSAATGATLTASKTRTWVRIGLIAVMPAMAFSVWQAAQPPTGWPAIAKPPRQAEFVYGVVREPAPGDKGEIDLWMIPPGKSRPRAYHAPYTRRLHEQVEGATRAVKAGMRVGIRRVAIRKGAHVERGQFSFYRLPPPLAPNKD